VSLSVRRQIAASLLATELLACLPQMPLMRSMWRSRCAIASKFQTVSRLP
jgi:uncharacterized protein involved in tolerance to divalent cations